MFHTTYPVHFSFPNGHISAAQPQRQVMNQFGCRLMSFSRSLIPTKACLCSYSAVCFHATDAQSRYHSSPPTHTHTHTLERKQRRHLSCGTYFTSSLSMHAAKSNTCTFALDSGSIYAVILNRSLNIGSDHPIVYFELWSEERRAAGRREREGEGKDTGGTLEGHWRDTGGQGSKTKM